MNNYEINRSRRGFVGWTLGTLGLFGILKFIPGSKQQVKAVDTVKMLDQNGKLVEVDASLLHRKKAKVSDEEILSWVKSKR
jgi:hypothetical protein